MAGLLGPCRLFSRRGSLWVLTIRSMRAGCGVRGEGCGVRGAGMAAGVDEVDTPR